MALRLALGTAVVAGGAAALWALAAGSAVARPGHFELKLAHGPLNVTAPTRIAFASRTATVVVTDARGTGAGWTLELNAAQPLPVARVDASCASGSSCTLPRARVVASGRIRLTVTFGPSRVGAQAVLVAFSVSP